MSGTESSRVRIGVIGLGRFGKLHSQTLSGIAEAELVALVARRPESLAAAQALLPGTPAWTSLDQALTESTAEAWVVACSTQAHVEVTRRLLAAGKTVLLEKPIAETLELAQQLAPFVLPDSRNLMLGHILLFNSEFQELRGEVTRRGRLAYIDCVRHRPATIVEQFAGENPLVATMVHDLYSVQVLVDRAEPDFLCATYHRTGAGAIDLAVARLAWREGPVASLTASYLTPAGMAPRGFDRMEVFGAGWAARINPNPRPFELWDAQAQWPMALEIRTGGASPTGMMAEELRCFCRVVRGEQPVPIGATYADGLQVQTWIERLTESAAQSTPGPRR